MSTENFGDHRPGSDGEKVIAVSVFGEDLRIVLLEGEIAGLSRDEAMDHALRIMSGALSDYASYLRDDRPDILHRLQEDQQSEEAGLKNALGAGVIFLSEHRPQQSGPFNPDPDGFPPTAS